MNSVFNPQALSHYLAIRHLPDPNLSWIRGKKFNQRLYFPDTTNKIGVTSSKDIIRVLNNLSSAYQNKRIGILLSSGIDSAIIASFLPKHASAYTVKFISPRAVDETAHASQVAKTLNLKHSVISIDQSIYEHHIDNLMLHKRAPLHPAEIAIHQVAMVAQSEGVEYLFAGSGADATFGGLDMLLSRDWTLDQFIRRYCFLDPSAVLNDAHDCRDVFQRYVGDRFVDTPTFLTEVFGLDTTQTFQNAVSSAGCKLVAPFSSLFIEGGLDLDRVRNGEPKYLLQEVYQHIFEPLGVEARSKLAFARPMDEWMSGWQGPKRLEFKESIKLNEFTGDQLWQLYCLERFMNLVESNYAS